LGVPFLKSRKALF